MKPFKDYQYIPGTPMSERDKKEVNSKFWNKGKWDNFILPLLPDSCEDMTFVDVGCNAGLFLKYAKDYGFGKVIGIDSDKGAITKALQYRNENKGNYTIIEGTAEKSIDNLPIADVTVLANIHYYMDVSDWFNYIDKLISKTRYVIIVTDEARGNPIHKVSASRESIYDYFKAWKIINEISISGFKDPHPRLLRSFIFRSPLLDRVFIDELDNGNAQQRDFYAELDNGIDPLKTGYGKRMKNYRLVEKRQRWTEVRYIDYMYERKALYESIKEKGLLRPIIIKGTRIVDGNHACEIMRHLGYKSVPVRRVK